MKPSASPNPASGPVRGLTWPILMTRLCAFAGMTRNTAGAASAPMPAVTTRRRVTDVAMRLSGLSDADMVPSPRMVGALYHSHGSTRAHRCDGRRVKRALQHALPPPLWGRVGVGGRAAGRGLAPLLDPHPRPLPTRGRGGARRMSFVPARRFQVSEHAGAQLGLLLGRPGAKAFARFHAELALRNELFQIGRRARPRVDRWQHGLMDGERQVGA